MKAALDHLARSRGAKHAAHPECLRLYVDVRGEVERWAVHGVRAAIEAHCTWTEVGNALGVTRQAAHERYAPLILSAAHAAAKDD